MRSLMSRPTVQANRNRSVIINAVITIKLILGSKGVALIDTFRIYLCLVAWESFIDSEKEYRNYLPNPYFNFEISLVLGLLVGKGYFSII